MRVEDGFSWSRCRSCDHTPKKARPAGQIQHDGADREAVDSYIAAANKKPGPVPLQRSPLSGPSYKTRQYARLVGQWIASIGTHSLRRTKATLICRRTGKLRAVQLLVGLKKIESTVRYLGIEVDDALAIAEQADV